MKHSYHLCSPWAVWLNYLVPDELQKTADYNDYLKKIHIIETYNDLIYFWQQSRFRDLHDFLVYETQPNTNVNTTFQVQGATRNISAINFFRDGINPTWEDPNNKFGGRLVFQIDKDMEKYQEIYEWLIFYFLGESEGCAEEINGIRFISHRSNHVLKFHYRVEVWTKFSLAEEAKVIQFRETFVKDFFTSFLSNNFNQKIFKPLFKNNQQAKEEKERKGHEADKHERDQKNKH